MTKEKKHEDQKENDKFESLIPEGEFPFPNETFERLMNNSVGARRDEQRDDVDRIVEEFLQDQKDKKEEKD